MLNDLPPGSALRLAFNALRYSVGGNPVTLNADMTTGSPTFHSRLVAATNVHIVGAFLGGVDAGPHTVELGGSVAGDLSGTGTVISDASLPGVHSFSGNFRTFGISSSVNDVVMPAASLFLAGRVTMAGAVFGDALVPAGQTRPVGMNAQKGLVRVGSLTVESGAGKLPSAMSLIFGLAGTTPGATYGQIRVQGTVTLANTTLELNWEQSFTPPLGQVFVLVDNDGTEPISGTFKNLPEGSTLSLGGVYPVKLSYVGGDGNDITLTSMSGAPQPSLALSSSANPARSRDCVAFTASLPPSATGTVTFYADGDALQTVRVVGGVARLQAALADGTVVVAQYNGDGGNGVVTSNSITQAVSPTAPARVSAITDFNGDGRSDIVWHNASSGQLHRMLMDAYTITQQATVYQEPNTAWSMISDGDFNGDGVADVLWRNAASGQVYLMLMDGNGFPMDGQVIYTEANPAWHIVATPDVDGDRNADLVWWNSSTGQQYVVLMAGFVPKQQGFVHTETNTQWRIVASGDFYGSCRDQLAWRNQQTGQVFLQRITTQPSGFTFLFDHNVYVEPDLRWKVIGASDLDGDGKADLLFRNDSTGVLYAALMDGATVRGGAPIYQAPLDWRVAAFGDYNGDGRSDLLLQNLFDGRVHMVLMYGLSPASQATMYFEPNLQWRIMGPAEYADP